MSGTELRQLQALIERVIPDPGGFAGRLLQQAILEYGQHAGAAATAFSSATAEDVVTDNWRDAEKMAVPIGSLLAAALGACECWGLRADCGLCLGRGSPGWTQPDPRLFDEFVRPAIEAASRPPAASPGERRPASRPSLHR
jgi:hypothetical protein